MITSNIIITPPPPQGCVPEVSRGVLSAALMLAAKEKISAAVRTALLNPPAPA
jgi:hypothetical protein